MKLDGALLVVIAVYLTAPGLGGHRTAQQGGGGPLLTLQVPLSDLGPQAHGLGDDPLLHLHPPVPQELDGILPGPAAQAAALEGLSAYQKQQAQVGNRQDEQNNIFQL